METYQSRGGCNITKLEVEKNRDDEPAYTKGQLVSVTLNTVVCEVYGIQDDKYELRVPGGGHIFPTIAIHPVPNGE